MANHLRVSQSASAESTIVFTCVVYTNLQYLDRKPRQPKLAFMRVLHRGKIGIWICWFLWREQKPENSTQFVARSKVPSTVPQRNLKTQQTPVILICV